MACGNPSLNAERARTRQIPLGVTEAELDKVARDVSLGRLVDPAKMGMHVGHVINRLKMVKQIEVAFADARWSMRAERSRSHPRLPSTATMYCLEGKYADEGADAHPIG